MPTDRRIFYLAHNEARRRAHAAIDTAPDGFRVEVSPPRRSLEQNDALHALLQDIADQCEWGGRKWGVEDWKRLVTAAYLRATGGHPVMVPGIDGHGFDVLYRRTRTMSKREMSELIEFVQAWAAEHLETA